MRRPRWRMWWKEQSPSTLINHGRIDHKVRKRNMISLADLHEALRQHDVDGEAHVDNVKVMTLEPSGKLSVVKIDPCRQDLS